MSRRDRRSISYTATRLARYEIQVWHDELNQYQRITSDDPDVVEQKALAKMAQWDEAWEKRCAGEQRTAEVEEKKQIALERTEAARRVIEEIKQILAHTLAVDNSIDRESLKTTVDYTVPKPQLLPLPDKPEPPTIPAEPASWDSDYEPILGFLDRILSFRREKRILDAKTRFYCDHARWKQGKEDAIEAANERIRAYNAVVMENRHIGTVAIPEWEAARREHEKQRDRRNAAVDRKWKPYLSGAPGAVADYCDMVLERSNYPDCFPKTYELDYKPQNQMVVVDYRLPAPDDLPKLTEVKYVQSRDEFTEKQLSDSAFNSFYDSVLYQLALRTIHELFEADQVGAVAAVAFNGIVRSIDRGTGREATACVISLQVSKEEFLGTNLAHVTANACFKKLKGVGSAKLHSLTPIAPIVTLDRDDKRFVTGYEVVDGLGEGTNLAAMDWEDFEHLIRELFEQHFAAGGGEVRVTRASRDGGVDAIAFDPDPISGGKIAIQAKRYTNTVGVSAVRDLYGTVVHEGATKGILVTTSSYGADAYEFARGKPLTLLDGANLLHLLQSHGHKARINLREAKELMRDA